MAATVDAASSCRLRSLSYCQHIVSNTRHVKRRRHGEETAYELTHLQALEAESVHIFREVAATFNNPACCSRAQDSVVMHAVAWKAFGRPPPLHPDARRHGAQLRRVIEFPTGSSSRPRAPGREPRAGRHRCRSRREQTGPGTSRNRLQTAALLRGITENRFDAVFGGARRDEEKARRQGASSASVTARAVGIPVRSAPSCGTSTTAVTTRRAHPRLPLSTGPSSTSGSTSPPGHRTAVDLLRP